MARSNELLTDAFDRVRDTVHQVVEGLTDEQLGYRPDPEANTIAWLVWHLTRVQDDHVADAAGTGQAWEEDGWGDRFGLPFPPGETGYGMSGEDVARVVASADLLAGYHDAVHRRTLDWVAGLAEDDYARVVDERWDPPVTLAVRLVSIVNDTTQHAGQAAYVRGLLERAGR